MKASKPKTYRGDLPKRVYFKHGSYFYVDLMRKWHNLGKEYPTAMVKWAELVNRPVVINTMNQLFDRYMQEIAPLKSEASYRQNLQQIRYLRSVFGDMKPEDVTPVDVYAYIDARKEFAKVAPNREKALLSHIFSKAIRWGLLKLNPCRDVKRIPEKKRNRYITDEEFNAVRSIAPEVIQHAMNLGLVTALRRGDLLKLKFEQMKEKGIEMTIRKTQIKACILWSERLRTCIDAVKQFAMKRGGEYLLCTRQGKPYTNDGFSTIWKRAVTKAMQEGLISEPFRFHDIRRKAATDAERARGREFARQLLGHQEQSTTAIYISGVELITPLF